MNNEQLKQTTAKVASGVFGFGHLAFNLAAEACLAAEKSVVSNLTDKSKQQIGLDREKSTSEKMAIIADKISSIRRGIDSGKYRNIHENIYGPKKEMQEINPVL